MSKVPDSVRAAADAAAARLRERAASVRPDEDLAASIAANAAAGDEFAKAYAALRELGLDDKSLDGFGLENATAAEMRAAADVLEQLARSEPSRRARCGRPSERSHRVGAVILAVVFSAFPILIGAGAFIHGLMRFEEWRHDPGGVAAAPRPSLPKRTTANSPVPARPRDHLTDRAGILSADAARALNERLAQFERETSNQLLVVVDRRLPPGTTLEELGSASIRQWGVGQQGKDNGVIFFVFVDDRKMRIEVGYGLESVLTDARAKRITSAIVKPLFQQGKYAEGIEAGAAAIMDVARGGDVAAAPPSSSPWPFVFSFALAAACLAIVMAIVRSLVRFLHGHPSVFFQAGGSFSLTSGSGWSDSSGSSGSDSSDSSGSFSSGGGDGGGGGASDSW
jgi:uncharacterized protein